LGSGATADGCEAGRDVGSVGEDGSAGRAGAHEAPVISVSKIAGRDFI